MARSAINLDGRRTGRSFRRLWFESLEDRRLLTTFTVTNLNDAVVTGPGSAPGTLRQAIYDANVSSDADLIQFASNLSGSISLSVIGDIDPSVGLSALLIDSPITIRGNANGITITRAATATDRRLIRVTGNGDLTLESITLSGGAARGATGSPVQNGGAGLGGALYNEGTLLVVSSTLLENIAAGGSAGAGTDAGAGLGGAIYNDEGSVSIRNSTLSNNSVVNGSGASNIVHSYGGALYSKNGLLKIYNSTVTNNSAYSGRELYIIGIGAGHTATAELYSSIIAQSDVQQTAFDINATDDLGGQLVLTGANNLIRSHNLSPSVVVSSDDPLLGAIANNGGPTLTYALLTGSPAIDHGSNPLNLTNDQRGSSFIRVVGGTADIGAFELQTAAPPELPGDYNGDSSVNAADYVVWCNTQGTEVPRYTGADGNGDGQIDNADYGVWRNHFGATLSAAAPVSTSTGGAANIEIATQPSDARIKVRSDAPIPASSVSASLGSYAAYFDNAATETETGYDKNPRVKRTLRTVPPEAHDLALLAVIAERSDGPTSFATATAWKDEFEGGIAHSVSNNALLAMDYAVIRSLLQMASPAAASNCTA